MENSSLNKAHQQQRRAEALLRQRKFDECVDCHKNAVECLTEACTLTENERSLESLRLQKEYHQKQIDFVRLKKSQMEQQYVKIAANQKRKISSPNEGDSQIGDDSLQAVFYRTFQVHDSLIDYLGKWGKRGAGSDNDSLKSYSTSDTEEKIEKDGMLHVVGNKHPKDESQIIEELKMLSGQLRGTVQCLLVELDDRNKEIDKLKARIKLLERKKNKVLKFIQGILYNNFEAILQCFLFLGNTKNNSSLKVITDSSGGTSPYVFSPCSELSPDVGTETGILPPLAPLEMPNLDFLSFITSNNNNNKN
ncbi:hypothetical protein NQ317_016439 [Molorchus minor]|uniref:Nuclear receptor-binding factor 2 MIT domain-containing protein n=1 Tax=Molorchus minor TaxID=1323400 RepID=A0ABQ9JYQ0_9CUCU|nr:hypothetical protein NQ317_016439 [Molorchus minor]